MISQREILKYCMRMCLVFCIFFEWSDTRINKKREKNVFFFYLFADSCNTRQNKDLTLDRISWSSLTLTQKKPQTNKKPCKCQLTLFLQCMTNYLKYQLIKIMETQKWFHNYIVTQFFVFTICPVALSYNASVHQSNSLA